MKRYLALLLSGSLVAACSSAEDAATPPPQGSPQSDASDQADTVAPDAPTPDALTPDGGEADGAGSDAQGVDAGPASCEFDYDTQFPPPLAAPPGHVSTEAPAQGPSTVAQIAHDEPDPPSTWVIESPWRKVPPESLTMPAYQDDMPLFSRGAEWTGPTRCYETPLGTQELTQAQAYDMYKEIAERTTGVTVDTSPEARTVVGMRGAYPGVIGWHGNTPNYFNDTLVLLWIDSAAQKNVREFPVNTDTGARNFGVDSSSSLRANRRYRYINGWHKTYNALHINEDAYRVRDDTNNNGHWDSDRNGWLPPNTGDDHNRAGGGHNIHMGSVDAPLGSALVDVWSAGCQVIPGMANWVEFITNAWTQEGDQLNYFLIDPRDIPPDVWAPCTPDGTHGCPYRIDALPFNDSRDTSQQGTPGFNVYNCSAADESGAEIVYELRIDTSGTLTVSVDCDAPVDVDVYLLEGDDAQACLNRADKTLTYDITPGRYLIVADTFVEGGTPLAGAYNLRVSLQ